MAATGKYESNPRETYPNSLQSHSRAELVGVKTQIPPTSLVFLFVIHTIRYREEPGLRERERLWDEKKNVDCPDVLRT